MKTNHKKNKGFVFMLTLFFVIGSGLYMAILTGISNNLVTETNLAYINACKKNMTKSALTYAKLNTEIPQNKTTQLDLSHFSKFCQYLKITPQPESIIKIEGFCQLASARMHINDRFKLPQ